MYIRIYKSIYYRFGMYVYVFIILTYKLLLYDSIFLFCHHLKTG